MRPPEFKPANTTGVLVELTGRTHGAKSLLVPSPKPKLFNEIVAARGRGSGGSDAQEARS